MSPRDTTREREPLPRVGDTIRDPQGRPNCVVDTRPGRLLLEDPNGFRFILSAYRLRSGWTHQPAPRPQRDTPSRPPRERGSGRLRRNDFDQLDEMRFAPRPRRGRRYDRGAVSGRP